MKKFTQICLSLAIAMPTLADDIEIYTGAGGGSQSNVLMILDTSGSMKEIAVQADVMRYDPNVVYDTSIYGFDPNAIYLFRFDQSRNSTTDLGNMSSDLVSLIKRYQVSPSAVKCPGALTTVANQGSLTASLLFWESGRGWSGPDQAIERMRDYERPLVSMSTSAIVECQRDWWEWRPYSYNGSNFQYIRDNATTPYTNSIFRDYPWDDTYSVLWSGNYLNYRGVAAQTSGPKTRLDVVKEAATDVVNSVTGVSIGLMRFSANGEGGFVDIPIKPVATMQSDFATAVNGYYPQGGTPLEESLYEAYLYMSGNNVDYGRNSTSGTGNGNSTYSTPSVTSSRKTSNTSQYQQPSALECTPSKIILFSDGDPMNDTGKNETIRNLVNRMIFDNSSYLSSNCSGDGGCAEELAYYLSRTDHRPDVSGTQNMTIDTIGGFIGEAGTARSKLRNIAQAGQGKFYEVDDYQSLYDSLKDSLTDVIVTPTTFTSPTVAVNSFNSLENSDELYFSVFEPNAKPDWKGNLKRYRVAGNGEVRDANNTAAVDSATGFFSITSQSFWSPQVDGPNVGQGGAASRLEIPRQVFTTNTSGLVKLDTPTNLTNATSIVGKIPLTTKTILTDELLGLDNFSGITSDYRDQLIGWILGYNDDATARLEMEDPLHSQPVVINYGPDDSVVFLSTNAGYLHAFSTNQNYPQEFFSIIPKELLTNPYYYFSSQVSTSDKKRYGLDGALTYWHDDKNLDGTVNGDDRLIVFVGMRRGGNSYYAFDVTDRGAPTLLWQKHGKYNDNSTANIPSVSTGYSAIGQTWSALTPVRIRMGNTSKVVLLAGGGYDTDEDGTTADGPLARITHDVGNTIVMIDPETGNILWSAIDDAQLTGNMTSSFPGDVVPIDRNSDGFIDMFYAADVGGRLWRFDLDITKTVWSDIAKGGIIADINDGSATGNRRFYNVPDVSYIEKDSAGRMVDDYFLISIGSGYRAHPLSGTTTDYHFLIKDTWAKVTPETYTAAQMSDFAEWATDEATATGVAGWYIPLTQSSEKVLSRSITAKGYIYFTTYAPLDPNVVASCGGDAGTGRLYIVNAYFPSGDTTPLPEATDESATVTDGKFVQDLQRGGLAPSPVVLFPPEETCEDGNCDDDEPPSCDDMGAVVLVGPEAFAGGLSRCNQFNLNYWREN